MIQEIRLPEISENVDSADVVDVLVKPGDIIQQDQSVIELETEKATFEVPSPAAGKVVEVSTKEGQKVNVGQVLIKLDTESKTVEAPESQPAESEELPQEQIEPAQPPAEQKPSEPTVSASPFVRQLAHQLGVDINQIQGTGPKGRISEEDVKRHARSISPSEEILAPIKETRPLPDFSKWGQVQHQKMTITRRKIADTLTHAWVNIPQVTQYDCADITLLEEFRKQYSDKIKQAGGNLTITSILLKVLGAALKEFPNFNASIDMERQEIIYKNYYHISVAVATDRGLLVPVMHDVDKKDILTLAVELKQLAESARENTLTPDRMVGGNFSISNLGNLGGTNFAPIIYWPQVAILGVCQARQQPVYKNGQLQPRLILPLSLSYDHRIIDGAEGLNFLRWIINALENPFVLLLQEKE